MTNEIRIVVWLGLVAVAAASCGDSQSHVLWSPRRDFSVTLSGSKSAPRMPLVTSTLIGSITGRSGDLCSGILLHRAHWFDTSFDRLYAPATWDRENVLRFRAPLAASKKTDRLSVRNETKQVVPCLRVFLSDLVLIVDIKPGQVVDLDVSQSADSFIDFSAEAKGLEIPMAPASLLLDRVDYPANAPITATVTITEGRLSLTTSPSSVDTVFRAGPSNR